MIRKQMKTCNYILIMALLLLLGGCSTQYTSSLAAYKGQSAHTIFLNGQHAFDKKNYQAAIKNFEALDALYPFGKYAQKGQFAIIKAYYKSGDMASTVAAADRYIHLYPRDPKLDYVYYMQGLANFNQYKSWVNKVYVKDPAERDLTPFRAAFNNFNSVVKLFPASKYAPDARNRMFYIRNAIARHQFEIADFYLKRKAYVAAANRAAYVVEHFNGTPVVIPALKLMVKAYGALGAREKLHDTLQMLKSKHG